MTLDELTILNYRNIREASLRFSDKLNCLVGLNGQGKTNVLDAIYMLSFAKSAYTATDSLNITHSESLAMVQGHYSDARQGAFSITCGLRRGQKKQFRRDRKDYPRLIDHIGLIPLVMVSPKDHELIEDGSDERRRFLDAVLSQTDRSYLETLTRYNTLLKQRNALLKQYEDAADVPWDLFEVLELQMAPLADAIYRARAAFVEQFTPVFERIYRHISEDEEAVSLRYVSQLSSRDLPSAYVATRQRDLILGWTSQGIHKDDLEMRLGEWPLKQVGSQGQQKTFLISMKLAQAVCLGSPILLLDDLFDKLDSRRVERIVSLLMSEQFGQIFITDTDRQHLSDILPTSHAKLFYADHGQITS